MKFIKRFIIGIICFVVLVGGTGFVLINLTPRQLKIHEVNLGNITLVELGLADTKLIDIYRSYKNLSNANEEEIVTNPYNEEQESSIVHNTFEESNLNGASDYTTILTQPVIYSNEYLISYSDTTLAYLFNDIIEKNTQDEAMQELKNANISIAELSILKGEANSSLKITSRVDLTSFKEEINQNLGYASNFISVPDAAFLISELDFTVSELGKIETTSKDIYINGDKENPLNVAILSVISSMLGEDKDETYINEQLGSAISKACYNLGKIGHCDDLGENNVVNGAYTLGDVGVYDHKLTLITHRA